MQYNPLKIGELVADIPIIQGGMGIGISLGGLAGAVAREGAIGILSAAQIGYNEEDFEKETFACNKAAIHKEYQKARNIAPEGIIGFNIMVAMKHYEAYVREAVAAGANLIISGAGLPTDLPKYVKESKTKIAPIVSTEKSARVILKFWDRKYNRTADMVVIEGPKAGGHLGFNKEQLEQFTDDTYSQEVERIKQVVQEYERKYKGHIPIILAGGIATPEDMKRVLESGIDGIQIATPFITTDECDADIRYKEAYIRAREEDIMIVKSPVGMPGRAIRNPFIETVMEGNCIPPKKCYQCLQKCNPTEIPYCITEALIHAAKGEIDKGLLFCGSEAHRATKIGTVKEVIAYYIDSYV